MGDVLVENPANSVAPHKKQTASESIPNIEGLEGSANDGGDEYSALKRYQRQLEYVKHALRTFCVADDLADTSGCRRNI